jgi:hypothetical protein
MIKPLPEIRAIAVGTEGFEPRGPIPFTHLSVTPPTRVPSETQGSKPVRP